MASIDRSSLTFLSDLQENNNRPWFADNKPRYVTAHENIKAFLADLVVEMEKIDKIEKNKLFRIYRDVRFSKDKTPYNPHWRMSMGREKPHLRGGYYLHVGPEESYVVTGFFNPEPKDLALIRGNINNDAIPFKKALNATSILKMFGPVMGDAVKTSPKGYKKDHPEIELLKMKQFMHKRTFTKEETLAANFHKEVVKTYKAIRPFFNYMSDILSYNLNGEPLY